MIYLARVIRLLVPHWRPLAGGFVCLLLVSFTNFATPQLLRRLIDVGIGRGNWHAVLLSSAGIVALAIGRGGVKVLQSYLTERASQDAAFNLRNQLYAKFQALSFSYHDQTQTSQLLTRMTSDVELVRQFAAQGPVQLLAALIS